MKFVGHRRLLIAVAVVAAGSLAVAADLESAWRGFAERQREAETAVVRFSMSRLLSKEHVANSAEPGSAAATGAADLRLDPRPGRVELSGDRVRYESWGPSFLGEDRGESVPMVSAFDGTLQRSFSDRSERPDGGSFGAILPKPKFDEWENMDLLPLFYAQRPLRPELFGPDAAGWRAADRPAVVDGVECLVIEKRPKGTAAAGPVIRAYLDANRGYVPLRVESDMRQGSDARLDLAYGRGEPPAWVPSAWSSTWLTPKGDTAQQSRAELERVTLGGPIADDRFTIAYPAGTAITDESRAGRSERLVVQADGTMVPRRSETNSPAGGSVWPWVTAVVLAAGVVVFLVLRRRATAA